MDRGLPFVLYRKPGAGELIGLFQRDAILHGCPDLSGRGFVMAPFDSARGMLLIQGDEVIRLALPSLEPEPPREVTLPQGGREEHMRLVGRGLEAIQGGRLQKVVLSKKWEVDLPRPPIEIFQNLLRGYPLAFCYLLYHPQVGTWCGASPESLLQIRDRELHSMALAGTLPYRDGESPPWSEKERGEQGMVTEYVRDRLAPFLETLRVSPVESIRAGQLWHLRTRFHGILKADADRWALVRSVHPTPAVCGLPKEAAKDFILEHEGYDRSFYTGFLGELNLDRPGDLSLFVNLRCMALRGGRAEVYAGGGITKGSDPLREWTEIQNKSRTMLGSL